MELGEPRRIVTVEPLEEPVPREEEVEAEPEPAEEECALPTTRAR